MSHPKIVGNPDAIIFEDHAGCAPKRLCYPGISSCITITGDVPGSMVGAHVTAHTPDDEFNGMMRQMLEMGGGNCLGWYVVGPIGRYQEEWPQRSRSVIANLLRDKLKTDARVRFFMTPPNVHIFAEREGAMLRFLHCPDSLARIPPYPAGLARTEIQPAQFVVR